MTRPGFSLIEILIALMISSFLMTIVFSTISLLQKSSQRYNEIITVESQQEIVFSQLQKDISAIVLPAYGFKASPKDKKEDNEKKQQEYYEKFAFQIELEGERLQTLTFITTSVLASYGSTKPRLVQVRYKLIPDEKNSKLFMLMREESSHLELTNSIEKDSEKKDQPVSYALGFGIKSMAIQCTLITSEQDNKKKVEEVSSWDFAERVKKQNKENTAADNKNGLEQKIALPHIITLSGSMIDPTSSQEYDYTYSFFILVDKKIIQKQEPPPQPVPANKENPLSQVKAPAKAAEVKK